MTGERSVEIVHRANIARWPAASDYDTVLQPIRNVSDLIADSARWLHAGAEGPLGVPIIVLCVVSAGGA